MSDKISNNEANFESEKVAALEAQVKQLTELLAAMMAGTTVSSPATADDKIRIVHLVKLAPGLRTIIKLSNLELNLTDFGEERTLTIAQFEEMIGKYRSWFKSGILAVHADDEAKAQHYGVTTTKGYPMDAQFVRELGNKTMDELEEVIPKLPSAGKEFIYSYWMRKAYAGDKDFANMRKLETLNRLSDGVFTQVMEDIKRKKNSSK